MDKKGLMHDDKAVASGRTIRVHTSHVGNGSGCLPPLVDLMHEVQEYIALSSGVLGLCTIGQSYGVCELPGGLHSNTPPHFNG